MLWPMASFPFLEHIRLFPTMEPLYTLAVMWNTLMMTNIFLSLRPQPECHLCREVFHNDSFPEHLPLEIILSYPVFPPQHSYHLQCYVCLISC